MKKYKSTAGFSKRHLRRLAQEEVQRILNHADNNECHEPQCNVSIANSNIILNEKREESLIKFNENINYETLDSITINEQNETTSVDITDFMNCNSENDDPLTDTDDELLDDNHTIDDTYSDDVHSYSHITESKGILGALRKWAIMFRIPHVAIAALLLIFHTYIPFLRNILPKDPRTLLKTPKSTEIVQLAGGEYWHYGLFKSLGYFVDEYKKRGLSLDIGLFINIDGLPLSRSSNTCFWPILMSDSIIKKVFIIGIFYGNKKPDSANAFLKPFIDELVLIMNDGFVNNQMTRVTIQALVCDAPAKSFILYTKGHTGYSSCSKCTIEGEFIENTVCFPVEKKPSSLRTDESFLERSDEGYHKNEKSILCDIPNIGLVSNVPLDYMHLICLGVVKKMLLLWMCGPLKVRLPAISIFKISDALLKIRNFVPKCFSRKPRSLSEVKYWKATEFRQFLLYSGPIVLRDILPHHIYINFLTLHVATTILITPSLTSNPVYIDYSEKLLKHFVTTFEQIYGKRYMSHNLHNLLHLSQDVRKFGSLDRFSAFTFENFLQSLKKMLRKGDKCLQQVARRFGEMQELDIQFMNAENEERVLEKEHLDGPVTPVMKDKTVAQYKILKTKLLYIQCGNKSNNKYCFLENGKILDIMNIIRCQDESIHVVGKEFKFLDSLYTLPCKSDKINIFLAEAGQELCTWPISAIKGNVWKVTDRDNVIVMPIRHTLV